MSTPVAPNPTRPEPHTEPSPDPRHRPLSPHPTADLAPQAALLEAAINSKPVTYAEACGAKNLAPPKRSTVKATTLKPY